MTKKLLSMTLMTIFLLSCSLLTAQEYCSFDEVNKKFLSENPELKKMVDISNAEVTQSMKSGKALYKGNVIYEIPVVVHVFTDNSALGSLGNPTDEQIQEWIDFTNALYANTYYQNNNSAVFPFRLVLAKRSPSCEETNGILRFDYSANQDYNDFGLRYKSAKGVTEAQLRAKSRWDPSSYYNIYVTNKIDGFNGTSGSGTNGFAYLFGAAGGATDGAYHHAGVVGKGKPTLGHEFGHALGLYHAFGQEESTTACQTTSASDPFNTGDLVADTAPTINGNYYRTVYGVTRPTSATINGCSNQPFDDIVINVMNYGSYRTVFTDGQVERSVKLFLQYRSSFLKSKALIPLSEDGPESAISLKTSCVPTLSTLTQGNYKYGMTRVQFGDIDVFSPSNSGAGYIFYTDYSKRSCLMKDISTELTEGNVYPLTINENSSNATYFSVYLDANNDGIFSESELLVPKISSPNNGVWEDKAFTVNVAIPLNSVKNTPLRLRIIGDNGGASYAACDPRSYGEVEDYAVTIKDNPASVWNGSMWSSEPTLAKEAIVRGNLSLSTNISAKNLTVESGSVTIKSGTTLTVENEIVNKLTSDKFIIEDGANVIQNNEAAVNTGAVTVNKNSAPMIFNDATLWSSPVLGQNVRSFSPNTLDKRFYLYNEATDKFASLFVNDPLYPNASLQDPLTYNFVSGLGYHIRVANTHTQTKPGLPYEGKFVGILNNGQITQPLTKDASGYNLIGNPYPSPIDATKLINSNSSILTLYFWTHEAPLVSGGYASNNYATFNLTGGTQASAGGLVPTGIIAQGQGFIAETSAATNFDFTNSLRTSNIGMFFKSQTTDSKRVWIDLYEGTQAKNQILIGYVPNATNDFDKQMDAKINNEYKGSALYSLINTLADRFVIQGRALPFDQNDVVKLGFEAKETAAYTIKLNKVENLDDETQVFLRDKMENQLVDLRKSEYTFNAEKGINNDRFEIVYVNSSLGLNEVKTQDVIVYKQNGQLVVKAPKEIKQIEVYDISGRKLFSKVVSGKEITLSSLKSTNQVLVIKIVTTDNKINNTKILY